jgi:hypothetical protein
MKYQEPVFNYEQAEKDLLDFMYPYSGYVTTDQYCIYDALHSTKKHVTEVKVRLFGLEYFTNKFNGEFLIEVDKYKKLQEEAQKKGFKLIYAFGFTHYKTKQLEAYTALNLTGIDLSTLPIKQVPCPVDTRAGKEVYKMKSCYIIPKGFLPESNTYTRIKKK